jgi:hypothetical protein
VDHVWSSPCLPLVGNICLLLAQNWWGSPVLSLLLQPSFLPALCPNQEEAKGKTGSVRVSVWLESLVVNQTEPTSKPSATIYCSHDIGPFTYACISLCVTWEWGQCPHWSIVTLHAITLHGRHLSSLTSTGLSTGYILAALYVIFLCLITTSQVCFMLILQIHKLRFRDMYFKAAFSQKLWATQANGNGISLWEHPNGAHNAP